MTTEVKGTKRIWKSKGNCDLNFRVIRGATREKQAWSGIFNSINQITSHSTSLKVSWHSESGVNSVWCNLCCKVRRDVHCQQEMELWISHLAGATLSIKTHSSHDRLMKGFNSLSFTEKTDCYLMPEGSRNDVASTLCVVWTAWLMCSRKVKFYNVILVISMRLLVISPLIFMLCKVIETSYSGSIHGSPAFLRKNLGGSELTAADSETSVGHLSVQFCDIVYVPQLLSSLSSMSVSLIDPPRATSLKLPRKIS